MIFNNIKLLGYKRDNKFFGEKSVNYAAVTTITIKGYVLDLLNNNGINTTYTGIETIKLMGQNFQYISINNVSYGSGKIKSISSDPGPLVKSSEYTITLEVLQNLSSSLLFNGINLQSFNPELIKNFNESFSIDFDNQSNVLGGKHSLEIQYDSPPTSSSINLLDLAKSLARAFLNTLPTQVSSGNYTTRTDCIILNSESYDKISKKCSFSKSFSYPINNNTKGYSVSRETVASIDDNGIVSAKETSTIRGENIPYYQKAYEGFGTEFAGAQSRCSAIFNSYKGVWSIKTPLNTNFIEKSVKYNKFDGSIEYTVVYNNDPKNKEEFYYWEYDLTIDRNEDWTWNISENGNIQGKGKLPQNKYSNAQNGYSAKSSGALSRITSFWTSVAKNEKASASLKLITEKISKSKYQGKIGYGLTYTDDPKISLVEGIRRKTIEVNDDGDSGKSLPPGFKEFIIPNNKYAIIQNRGFKRQGTRTYNIKPEIGYSNPLQVFNGYSFFQELKNLASYSGNDSYIESIGYESDEIEKNVSLKITYKYS